MGFIVSMYTACLKLLNKSLFSAGEYAWTSVFPKGLPTVNLVTNWAKRPQFPGYLKYLQALYKCNGQNH